MDPTQGIIGPRKTKEKPVGQTKWNEILKLPDITDRAYLYLLPFRCKINAMPKYFQYQIYHISLITRQKLFKFKLLDHETCDICGEIENENTFYWNVLVQN